MRRALAPLVGLVIGGLIGVGSLLALGADNPPQRAYPRYTVNAAGGSLLITDNDDNKLFVYQNLKDSEGNVVHHIHHILDLSQVGQADMKPKESAK